jgi:hypothetical protein
LSAFRRTAFADVEYDAEATVGYRQRAAVLSRSPMQSPELARAACTIDQAYRAIEEVIAIQA